MGEKDISEKYLEEYPDVFADIFNSLLLQKEYVHPEQLHKGPTESIYKAENGRDVKEMRRDISKYYIRENQVAALFGIENQSMVDESMPVRVMGYDHASYRSQMLEEKGYYPVVTLVLNFSDSKWEAPLALKDLFDCPEELETYIGQERIKVINVAYLPREVRRRLKSDFRIIADFFRRLRNAKRRINTAFFSC